MSNTPFPMHRVLEQDCPCFAGTCRGGQVIDGKTACGQRCKAQLPARTEILSAEEIGGIFWTMPQCTMAQGYLHFARRVEAAVLRKINQRQAT